MCGRCRNVFNAFESLKRIEDEEDVQPSTVPTPVEKATGDLAEFPTLSTDNLEALVPEAPPEFTAMDEAEFARPAELATGDSSSDGPAADEMDAHEQEVPVPDAIAKMDNSPPTFLLADPGGRGDSAGESGRAVDNPLLQTSYRPDRSPRRALWIIGILLLLTLSTIQSAFLFRAVLMENLPQTRPWLKRICEFAACTISWGRDEAAIRIEASDLIESPAKPGRILLTATLVNRSKQTQELPALELRLTDSGNQILASRVLQPRDYLGRLPAPNEVMAPGAELFVNLNFEIANKAPASGYGLRAFYP